jgi:hypothetical protein
VLGVDLRRLLLPHCFVWLSSSQTLDTVIEGFQSGVGAFWRGVQGDHP